jgi:DNA transposition AAA+ family ATPase
MNTEIKDAIVAAAKEHMTTHSLTAANLANAAEVNEAYLSNMLRGIYTVGSADKPTAIQPKYFTRLAEAVGYTINKVYWKTVDTPQLREGIATLENAKEFSRAAMLICDSGAGKTYMVKRFLRANPQHTYVVTVSHIYRMLDVINDIRAAVGLRTIVAERSHLLRATKTMVSAITDIRETGGRPLIILDEAENLYKPTLMMMKALYDELNGQCGIVMIGTNQLLRKMEKMRARDAQGMPQLYRRFKAGLRVLPTISRADLMAVTAKQQIEDKGLVKLLVSVCENYGELHDYLEPVMREADLRGVACDEAFFRLFHNMPA